jgi:type I restriction enzyme S subunit
MTKSSVSKPVANGSLPPGWTTARAGDILKLVNGAAFKPTDWADNGLPIIRIQNLNNPTAAFNRCPKSMPEKIRVRNGDLLFAWSGTPGTSFGAHIWQRGEAWLNQHIFRVGFDINLFDPEFLRIAINRNLQDYIAQAHGGAGLAHITKGRFEASSFLLPPRKEQRRIVARLQALEARSRRARAALDAIPPLLAQTRQSILASAFCGDLTRNWRKKHASEKWKEVTLTEVIVGKPKNGYSAPPVNCETPYRVLSLGATTLGRFDARCFKFIEGPIPENSNLWLEPGDILVQRGNTIDYVGVPAVYNGPTKTYIYPDLMMRFRANESTTTAYLHFALSREEARNFLRARATGTAGNMPKINQPTLLSVPVPLPHLSEQQEIVRLLESAFARLDAVAAAHASAIAVLDRLDQSILARAFRGELVPQDPAEEPAQQLLARIKKSRELAVNEAEDHA